ncbi:MAG TPA: hypothetical protein PKC28_02565 [Bdellovibrionales bacterium]|nr:hypothetical protein [Bdellovibrionales bacterium]
MYRNLVLPLLFATVGCVSVNVGTNHSVKRAKDVAYRAPSAPFAEESRPEVDAVWKNPRNGNVISFVSDCQDPSDPPLDSIVQGVLVGLAELNYDSKQTVTVQGREGRRVKASGKVDGVPTSVDMLAFKRNHCIYILNYLGVKESVKDDQDAFNRFIEGFRAP